MGEAALSGLGGELVAETMGVAGEQEGGDDARRPQVHDVFGQIGCEDGVWWCGEAGYFADMLKETGVHGWILAAVVEEMKDLNGQFRVLNKMYHAGERAGTDSLDEPWQHAACGTWR